jgi:hypothetical protein
MWTISWFRAGGAEDEGWELPMGRSLGRVAFTSRNGGMVVVQHADGFALIEMLGDEGELQPGDDVTADWSELGGGCVGKDGVGYDVYFQGSWGGPDIPVRMARQMGGG